MAEELENEVEEEGPSGKFPIKWVIVGITVLVLAGGGYVGWSMVQTDAKTPEVQEETSGDAASTSPVAVEPEVGQTFDLDPFVVNLNEPGGKRYLKAKIGLEFIREEIRVEMAARVPQLRDIILLYLSSKTLEEIQSVDGKIELKNALITRVNQVLKTGKVRNIYFTQFVIQ